MVLTPVKPFYHAACTMVGVHAKAYRSISLLCSLARLLARCFIACCVCSSHANIPQPSRMHANRLFISRGTRILKHVMASQTVTADRPMRCAGAFVTPRRPRANSVGSHTRQPPPPPHVSNVYFNMTSAMNWHFCPLTRTTPSPHQSHFFPCLYCFDKPDPHPV